MKKSEFAGCMAFLSAAVGREISPPQAEAWSQLLGDLTESELRAGIVGALAEHPVAGFPPVGNIRKHARPLAAINDDTRAVAAWEGVLEAIRRVGGYATVQFDDPAVTATVRALGGWVRLTERPTDELMRFVRPQFVQTYKALLVTGVRAESAEPLIGLIDAGNLPKGLPPEKPVPVRLGLPGAPPRLLPGLVHSPESRELGGNVFLTVAERALS